MTFPKFADCVLQFWNPTSFQTGVGSTLQAPRGLLDVVSGLVNNLDPAQGVFPCLTAVSSKLMSTLRRMQTLGERKLFPLARWDLSSCKLIENENVCLYRNFLFFMQEYNLSICLRSTWANIKIFSKVWIVHY